MVATDFLGQDDARRVLALRADSAESVSYSVMRTGRGDLIDSSPARRVEVVSGRSDGSSRTIAQDCAQLLANADSDAINELGKLLWCMGVVLVAYCLVALPRIRRQGLEEA